MINTSTSDENLCGLKRTDFQKTVDGKQTDLFILKNENGVEIAVTNYGGAVLAIMAPDKNGKFANVIQGHDSIDHVINSHEPFLSTLIGRYGNRIANGKFLLDGMGWPNSTAWPFLTRISRTVPENSLWISFISFMDSTMKRVSPFLTVWPTATKSGLSGAGFA